MYYVIINDFWIVGVLLIKCIRIDYGGFDDYYSGVIRIMGVMLKKVLDVGWFLLEFCIKVLFIFGMNEVDGSCWD